MAKIGFEAGAPGPRPADTATDKGGVGARANLAGLSALGDVLIAGYNYSVYSLSLSYDLSSFVCFNITVIFK